MYSDTFSENVIYHRHSLSPHFIRKGADSHHQPPDHSPSTATLWPHSLAVLLTRSTSAKVVFYTSKQHKTFWHINSSCSIDTQVICYCLGPKQHWLIDVSLPHQKINTVDRWKIYGRTEEGPAKKSSANTIPVNERASGAFFSD
jgi:hypothetical protein